MVVWFQIMLATTNKRAIVEKGGVSCSVLCQGCPKGDPASVLGISFAESFSVVKSASAISTAGGSGCGVARSCRSVVLAG